MDSVRMVKVDNWAAFFLQKLQALYTRGDFTDLTLQFHTNECIKVHRLVLNTCTEYFETLIQQNNATNHMRLPPNFQSDVVVPIINFMYSGRLEFRPELHHRLYHTAKILNMHILTKLLDTHAGPVGKTNTVQKLKHLSPVPSTVSSPSMPSTSMNTRTFMKSEYESADIVPGKRLPIWKKRTVPSSSFSVNVSKSRPIADEPAKPTRFEWPDDGDSDSAPILYSSTFDDISYDSVPIVKSINSIVQSALPPTPSQPLVQLPQQRVMPAATFESVYQSANLKRNSPVNAQEAQPDGVSAKKMKVDIAEVKELVQEQEVRKTLITDDPEQENEDLDDFLPVADQDAEDFDDDNEEVHNDSMNTSNMQFAASTPPSSCNSPSNTRNTPKPILKVHDSPDTGKETTPSKKVRFHLEPKVHAVASSSDPLDVHTAVVTEGTEVQVSESHSSDDLSSGTTESSQPVGVVNTVRNDDNSNVNSMEARATPKKSSDVCTNQSKSPNSTNHAKIIAEVLKKYPDLVKNNKNIRLKIIQKDGSPAVSVEKPGAPVENKSKVSYMVVKADQAVKAKAQIEQYKSLSGIHNTTGPWICSTCDPGKPINFDTYYNYRKHLQDVHQEKIDVRICEHCGHRASKRNLLLYHLYKIHGIPPPPSCNFPKCDECSHIALSETLLAKHKNVHIHSSQNSSSNVPGRAYECRLCNVTFSSQSALSSHLQSSQRCNPRKKSFKCPICSKVFQLQVNLKNHIRSDHPNLKLLEDMEQTDTKNTEHLQVSQTLHVGDVGQQQQLIHQQSQQHLQSQQLDEQQQPPHQHSHASQEQLSQQVLQAQTTMEVQQEVHTQGGLNTQPQTTYILQPGVTILTDNNQATLMPSTEAEALSNVASGIAASLGVADSMVISDQGQHQTFIVVDKNLIPISGPPGAPGQVHEYIVPDVMNNDMSQSLGVFAPGHLSQLVQYTTAGGGGLQQPVAVSTTEQGLMTITTVNANGSIVNHTVSQQGAAPIMETAMMQIPQGHMQDHSGGEITMILTDHAYSEGIVRENGGVMQATSVPVSMSMVPTSAVVSVVSGVPSIPTTVATSRPMGDNGVHHVMTSMAMAKVEENSDATNSSSVNLDAEQQASGQPTQKMAELASDWDDVDESEDNSGLSRSADEAAEDAALPSRPTIMLKSELDGDEIPDNLPMKIA